MGAHMIEKVYNRRLYNPYKLWKKKFSLYSIGNEIQDCRFISEYIGITNNYGEETDLTHEYKVDFSQIGRIIMWKPNDLLKKDGSISFCGFDGYVLFGEYGNKSFTDLSEIFSIDVPYGSALVLEQFNNIKTVFQRCGIPLLLKEYTK